MVVWTLFIVAVLTAFVGLGLLAWGPPPIGRERIDARGRPALTVTSVRGAV